MWWERDSYSLSSWLFEPENHEFYRSSRKRSGSIDHQRQASSQKRSRRASGHRKCSRNRKYWELGSLRPESRHGWCTLLWEDKKFSSSFDNQFLTNLECKYRQQAEQWPDWRRYLWSPCPSSSSCNKRRLPSEPRWWGKWLDMTTCQRSAPPRRKDATEDACTAKSSPSGDRRAPSRIHRSKSRVDRSCPDLPCSETSLRNKSSWSPSCGTMS